MTDPTPVPPELIERAAHLSWQGSDAPVAWADLPPSARAMLCERTADVLAAVYGDIVEAARRDALEDARWWVGELYTEDSYPPPRGTHSNDDDPLSDYDSGVADAEIAVATLRDVARGDITADQALVILTDLRSAP